MRINLALLPHQCFPQWKTNGLHKLVRLPYGSCSHTSSCPLATENTQILLRGLKSHSNSIHPHQTGPVFLFPFPHFYFLFHLSGKAHFHPLPPFKISFWIKVFLFHHWHFLPCGSCQCCWLQNVTFLGKGSLLIKLVMTRSSTGEQGAKFRTVVLMQRGKSGCRQYKN